MADRAGRAVDRIPQISRSRVGARSARQSCCLAVCAIRARDAGLARRGALVILVGAASALDARLLLRLAVEGASSAWRRRAAADRAVRPLAARDALLDASHHCERRVLVRACSKTGARVSKPQWRSCRRSELRAWQVSRREVTHLQGTAAAPMSPKRNTSLIRTRRTPSGRSSPDMCRASRSYTLSRAPQRRMSQQHTVTE